MHTPFTLWMNFLLVQMINITDLYDYINSYTVIILYVLYALYVFDMFHILLPGDSLRDLRNVYMYVCHMLFRVLSACHLFQTCARIESVRANFKQLYLHTHCKLDACLYELIYSEQSILPPTKIFTIPPETLCINCHEIFGSDHLLLISAQTIQTFLEKQMKTMNT